MRKTKVLLINILLIILLSGCSKSGIYTVTKYSELDNLIEFNRSILGSTIFHFDSNSFEKYALENILTLNINNGDIVKVKVNLHFFNNKIVSIEKIDSD